MEVSWDLSEWLEFYRRDREGCMAAVFAREDRHALCYALFSRLFDGLREKYRALGISEKIYADTRSDLEIWRENCRAEFGEDGLHNWQWLQNHLDLRLYRLGRLQFEPWAPEGRLALNVHVPQGEPLLYDAVQASYREAYRFYRGMTRLFTCHSWLLSPVLREILPESANIVRFGLDYGEVRFDPDDRQCEERVFGFGRVTDDFASYPQDTSLRRAVRERLLAGGKMGAGAGEFLLEV